MSLAGADKGHPDPTGALLRRLIPVLEMMVGSCTRGRSKGSPDQKHAAWGIVWDFMSLPQRGYTSGYDAEADDRTPYQLARFSAGLKGINVWYGHMYATTLICDWPMPEGATNSTPYVWPLQIRVGILGFWSPGIRTLFGRIRVQHFLRCLTFS